MTDIKIDANYRGLTYILADYAKSVNGGKDVKMTAKQWQKTMEIVAQINSKRSSDNAIYQGGSNLFGDINENFVLTSQTITFTQDEMAAILKEMGIDRKPANIADSNTPEDKPIKGLSVEKNSTPPSPEKSEEDTQQTQDSGFEEDFINGLTEKFAGRTFSPDLGRSPETLTLFSSMSERIEKMAKARSAKIVSAASDTINLAPPFEIKTPKPGDLGGETKTISHKLHTKLMNLAEELHCNYEDLITVMNFESGMNPKEGAGKKNKAVGLIQFTNNAIKELNKNYSLNLTKDKITAMNAEEQIDIVGKYLKMCISRASRLRNKTKLDAADLYSVIILPGRAGSDILCRKGEKNANGKLLRYYESNAGIDVGKDGIITRADVLAKLDDFRVNVKVV